MKFTTSQLRVLDKIKDRKKISRKKIAEELDLTPAAITKTLEPLLESGVVLEDSQGKSTGGRKPTDLVLNKDWIGKILGISMTPREVIVSISNINGEIFSWKKLAINLEDDCLDILKKIIADNIVKTKNIKIISFVSTGLINSTTGEIIFSPHYKWKRISIKERLEKQFNIPILIENDVRAMALSEKYFGCCASNKDYVVLNISEGIGSSMIINGDLFSGHGYISGEIGHVVMDRSSLRKCSCGKRGCLEAIASNSAIINRLESMIHLNNYSSLKEILKSNGKLEIKDVLKAVEKRDFLTTKVSTEAMVTLAHGIDMIISLLNPEKIILMGEIFKERLLLNTMKLELQKVTLEEQKYELVVSELLDNIHIYNPVSVVIHNLFRKNIWGGES